MPCFYYHRHRQMTVRNGVDYSTTYIQQTPEEHQRLLTWLIDCADQIDHVADQDPDMAQWLSQPLKRFRRSQRGRYYSALDIVMDAVTQMHEGRDLTQAMLGRWNRLFDSTPWQLDLIQGQAPSQPTQFQVLFAT
jgi:hypothetical protein